MHKSLKSLRGALSLSHCRCLVGSSLEQAGVQWYSKTNYVPIGVSRSAVLKRDFRSEAKGDGRNEVPSRRPGQADAAHQTLTKSTAPSYGAWQPKANATKRTTMPKFSKSDAKPDAKNHILKAPPGPSKKKSLFGSTLNNKRPSSRLVAMVRTVEEAEKAAALSVPPDSNDSLLKLGQRKGVVFAVDTETTGVDPTAESPVWNGKVVCFSVYCGPTVDFAEIGCGTLLIDGMEGEESEDSAPLPQDVDGDSDANKTARLWVDTAGDHGEKVLGVFRAFFESEAHCKVFHNYSFDSHVLANHGIRCQGFGGDTVHMARLWDTSRAMRGGYKLSSLCDDLLGWGKTDMKKVFGRGARKKDGTEGKLLRMPDTLELHNSEDEAVFNRWVAYATFDTLCTWFLFRDLKTKLQQTSWHPDPVLVEGKPSARGWSLKSFEDRKEFKHPKAGTMMDFYDRVWRPFGQVLVDMERAGMYIDTPFLEQQTAKAEEFKENADAKFREWAAGLCADGVEVNTNSTLQKRHLLYSSRTVVLKGSKPLKHRVSGLQLVPGQPVELAWHDAEKLVKEGKADDVLQGNPPDIKTFTVKNTAGLVREGSSKPPATREIRLTGLRLRPTHYTATGLPSTASNVIQALAGRPFSDPPVYGKAFEDLGGTEEARKVCEALGYLMEAEATEKLLNTFLRPLPKMVDHDSRIHSSVNLNTETGRLSSQRPNLQNQPALEKDRYQVRKAFRPAPGNKFIVADYGQLELRIMAHMTRCKSMIEALEAGGDFHSRTAIDMYRHVREAVESGAVLLEPRADAADAAAAPPLVKDKFANERKSAKIVNFSIAYGKTRKGLSVDLRVTPEEAQQTIDRWYDARREVKEWQDKAKELARSEGYAATLLGRRRVLEEINSADSSKRGHAQRGAINTPIQGGAADVVVMAMLRIARSEELRRLRWRMVMQIHDELIVEGPAESAEEAFAIVRRCMENPFQTPLLVKLPVDGGVFDSWFEGK